MKIVTGVVCVCVCVSHSVVSDSAICQAQLSMEFSRQEYWSGLPFPSPGDLPDPGIEPGSLVSSAVASRFFTSCTTREAKIGKTRFQRITRGSYVEGSYSFFQFINHIKESKRGHGTVSSAAVPP